MTSHTLVPRPPTTALLCSATTDAADYESTLIAGADPHVRHDDPAHQCPASLHDSDRTTLYKTFARSACRVLAGSGKIHILSTFVDILRLVPHLSRFKKQQSDSMARMFFLRTTSSMARMLPIRITSLLVRLFSRLIRPTRPPVLRVPRSWPKVTNDEMEATSIFS